MKERGFCIVCGKPFLRTRESHVCCSNTCAKRNARAKKIINGVGFDEMPSTESAGFKSSAKPSRYCPLNCEYYHICGKRLGDEFEYVTSGGGIWRSLRGC